MLGSMAGRRAKASARPDAATAAIAAADPAFAAFIDRAGRFEPRPGEGDPFTSLARAIVFQQLAGRAASAIYGRFVAAIGGTVTADAILGIAPEQLRAAGLSGNKTLSLIDLATKVREGTVPLDGIEALADDEIVTRLTTVRGIGPWTAEMFLLFELGRPDVWPVDDLGIRNAVKRFYGLEPTKDNMQQVAEPWRPWRSVASWYLWRSLSLPPV